MDLRAPDFGTPRDELYAEALAMCAWADERHFDHVSLTEHHGVEDGYLPTPFVMGAAIASRTKTMRLVLGAVLLPLHDPVKVAEQIAVTDIISGGRLQVVLGAGYVKSEFAMFRRSLSDRGRLLDEGVPIILRALSGERFVAGGREIFVRPLPLQRPHELIAMGGGVAATAKRAARLGVGLTPMYPGLVSFYEDECARCGHKPGRITIIAGQLYISEDPERTWTQIAPHVLHLVRSYAKLAEGTTSSSPFEGVTTMEQVRQTGVFQIVTPDEAVTMAKEASRAGAQYTLNPLIGGLDPKIGWQELELLADKVLPRLSTAAN
jgi:alkanesulfonate monooxygenase SsuD/methylene tetrahydromethanopterin reductase-like flavin-dependent oxidoreductase (luciferase family)